MPRYFSKNTPRPSTFGADNTAPLAVALAGSLALLSACSSGSPGTPGLGSATDNAAEEQQQSTAQPSTENETQQESTPVVPESENDTPIACGPIDLSARLRIIERINEVRATGRNCGREWYPATGPVTWNDSLEQAAIRHSRDLAAHDIFSHTGSDGSSVSDRASDAGYNWNRIGENIAAGQSSVEDAITGWVGSPGHCSNLMEPDFSNVSLACESNNATQYNTYWTQVLGNEF